MVNVLEFVPVPTRVQEDGCLFEVRIRGMIVGRIRRYPSTEMYAYYRGPRNTLVPLHADRDLDELLERIARNP